MAKLHKQIVFILDNRVLESEKKPKLDELFSGIFGNGNYVFGGVAIDKNVNETNDINGKRINRTQIINEDELLENIASMPEAVVLSSIPLSDPRISALNEKISTKNLANNFSAKTLQLLDLNSIKENQTLIAPDAMGFLGRANNRDELFQIFKNHEGPFVIKEIEASAGGTAVNFIMDDNQKNAVLEKIDRPILVFQFFDSIHLVSQK